MSLHTPAAILQRIIYNANHTVMTFPPGEELAMGWGGVGNGVGVEGEDVDEVKGLTPFRGRSGDLKTVV